MEGIFGTHPAGVAEAASSTYRQVNRAVVRGMVSLGIMQTLVETSAGEARISTFTASGRCRAVVVLGHGAGGGIEAPDLQALAGALPSAGVEVVLVEQPWRVVGKRIAPAPKTLDSAWRDVLAYLSEGAAREVDGRAGRVPVIVGGRSAGARVACRTGLETGSAGVLALAFPLHPPGKPEMANIRSRTRSGFCVG